MENQIKDWIKQAKESGLDERAIVLSLKNAGWSEELIQQTLTNTPPVPQESENMRSHLETSNRNRRIGIICIISPFIALVLVLLVWAVVTLYSGGASSTDSVPTWVLLIQWLLGFVGLLSVLGMLILVPLGIHFMHKKSLVDYSQMDDRSGKGERSIIPAEITGWNWGAALLTWIWGIGNNVWISLLVLLPFVSIFWWIVLGIHGNEWAWKARSWESVAQFKATQRKWTKWSLIILACYVAIILIVIALAFSSASSS